MLDTCSIINLLNNNRLNKKKKEQKMFFHTNRFHRNYLLRYTHSIAGNGNPYLTVDPYMIMLTLQKAKAVKQNRGRIYMNKPN